MGIMQNLTECTAEFKTLKLSFQQFQKDWLRDKPLFKIYKSFLGGDGKKFHLPDCDVVYGASAVFVHMLKRKFS